MGGPRHCFFCSVTVTMTRRSRAARWQASRARTTARCGTPTTPTATATAAAAPPGPVTRARTAPWATTSAATRARAAGLDSMTRAECQGRVASTAHWTTASRRGTGTHARRHTHTHTHTHTLTHARTGTMARKACRPSFPGGSIMSRSSFQCLSRSRAIQQARFCTHLLQPIRIAYLSVSLPVCISVCVSLSLCMCLFASLSLYCLRVNACISWSRSGRTVGL